MGMKRFDPRSVDYNRLNENSYCPFDPELTHRWRKDQVYRECRREPGSLQYDHFKELGRFISVDLKEDKVKCELRKRFLDDMEKVEGSGVNGLCKVFLYEHFIVPR